MKKDNLKYETVNFDPFQESSNLFVSTTEPQREILTNIFLGGHHANCSYNESVSLLLTGNFNFEWFQKSIPILLKRHKALRSVFSKDGMQLSFTNELEFNVPFIDLSNSEETVKSILLSEIIDNEAETEFDIHIGPLYRFKVIKLSSETHRIILSFHHIICDGWSLGIIMQDLSRIYSLFKNNLPVQLEPAYDYTDYANEEAIYSVSEEYEATESFWLKQYQGNIPSFEFPIDLSRPAVRTFNAKRVDVEVDPLLVENIRKSAIKQGVSFVTFLTAAFEVFLHRITTGTDIVVALPAAGQSATGHHGLVGHCVNVLPLRTNISPEESFCEYVKRRKSTLLDAYDHQHFTFGSLVRKLNIPRDPSRIPLVPIAFNIDIGITNGVLFEGCEMEFSTNPRHYENFEIFINASGSGSKLILECTHNTDLFQTDLMQLRMQEFVVMLRHSVDDPQTTIKHLRLITEDERKLVFETWNSIENDFSTTLTIDKWFEKTCDTYPERIAVSFDGQGMKYRELNEAANKLAAWIKLRKINEGSFIGILVNRNFDLIISMLGILKAGCVYVPIDPGYPFDRINHILSDSNCNLLILSTQLKTLVPDIGNTILTIDEQWADEIENLPDQNPESQTRPSQLAYIIYTSGSTGKPKGSLIEHRNVTRLFTATETWYKFNYNDVWTMFHSAAFDFSVWEIWGALLYGGKLVIVPFNTSRDPDAFYQLLINEKVTILNQTPSAFRTLVQVDSSLANKNERVKNLRFVIFGGEALEMESLRPWINHHGDSSPQLVNMYGITETTVHVTYRPVSISDLEEGVGSMIGVPIRDLQVYILDENQQPVPIGIPGEMYVGGAGVGRGYLNKPDLTSQKFLFNEFNPFAETPLYRSGDLARYKLNGDIEYLGRIDNQVKIRGFRIELGEIEYVLEKFPPLRQQVVIAREDVPGDKKLVAYVVLKENAELNISEVREYMKKELPDYMIPSAFVQMEHIPVTGNGKTDRKALPRPENRIISGNLFEEPKTPIEQVLANIWCSILSLEKVGRRDNFFELGGHSILGVKMLNQVENQLGVKINLSTLFAASTIEEIARIINNEGPSKPISCLVPLQTKGTQRPLFCIHMHNGNVNRWRVMIKYLGDDQPVYAIQPLGLDSNQEPHRTIEEMALHYVHIIKEVQPHGPYNLIGLCFSGMVVFEMAALMQSKGEKVAFLSMVNNYAPPENPTVYRIKSGLNKFMKMDMGEKFNYTIVKNLNIGKKLLYKANILTPENESQVEEVQIDEPSVEFGHDLRTIHSIALLNYHPEHIFNGNLFIFRTADPIEAFYNEYLGWDRLVTGKIETTIIEGCDNDTIITEEPYNAILSMKVKEYLDKLA